MRRRGRYICWDLDETIGDFRDRDRLRPTKGIRPLLERLKEQGVGHVLTTSASLEHALHVLKSIGIYRLFDGVFPGERICDYNWNKYYMSVAVMLGISAREAPHEMIVIGDFHGDAPADVDMPFILHPFGSRYHAEVFGAILDELMELSPSWMSAYRRLAFRNLEPFGLSHFEGGAQRIRGIGVLVGQSTWNPRPFKKFDSIIAVLDVPEEYKRKEREVTQPECFLLLSRQRASPEHQVCRL